MAALAVAPLPAATPALAAEDEAPRVAATGVPVSREEVAPRRDGRRTIGRLPANLGRSAIGVFHADNVLPLVVGSASAATASLFDQDVRTTVVATSDWGDAFETGAGPIWSSAFVAGMFTAGRLSGGPRFRAMTYDLLDAAVVNFAYTEVIKVAVGRERPNGQDNQSFPSGHTSNAFALAAVAERHYGWKLGVPAYLLAGVVGASRIHQDKHYLSDVVAGAALGYVVGRTVVRVNSRPLEEGRRVASVQVSPTVARRTWGARLVVVF